MNRIVTDGKIFDHTQINEYIKTFKDETQLGLEIIKDHDQCFYVKCTGESECDETPWRALCEFISRLEGIRLTT